MHDKKTARKNKQDSQFSCWPILCGLAFLASLALPARSEPLPQVYDQAASVIAPARMDDASPLRPRRIGRSPRPHAITIAALSEEKRSAETGARRLPGTPHKIGLARTVPPLSSFADTVNRLQWQTTPQGGRIAAISITSQQATGMRLGILVGRLPGAATLRFYAQGAQTSYEFSGQEIADVLKRNLDAGDSSDEGRTYWTPHIEGEETTLEVDLPQGIGPEEVEISIPRISHFFSSPLAAQGTIKSIGAAASCELDVSCYSSWSPESNATAKMLFVDSGSSYQCTGTLLADSAASKTPYFLSANHCIATQTSASTLQTFWFYRSTACNSGILNPGTATLSGGATLLYTSTYTDTSFMKLLRAPPAGAIFSGWSTSPQALGTAVTGIHHPHGDLQKISFGALRKYQNCTNDSSDFFTCVNGNQGNTGFYELSWSRGISEPGSSGSGLFVANGNSLYLIGQLYGGGTSCGIPTGTENYGRFDIAYNAALQQWLSAASVFTLSVSKSGNGSGTVSSSPSGINCATTCSASFAGGSSITLTASATGGSVFSGWSGACTGAGTSCSLIINTDSRVTANFVAPVAPSAPTNVTAVAGNGSASVSFTPGSIGSGTLVNYLAGCGIDYAHLIYGTGGSSPLTVTGLSNGTTYYCWVQAISSVGYGTWSQVSNPLTPTAGLPTCTLSASPASISAGGSSLLTARCTPVATTYRWTGGTCAGTSAPNCTVTPSLTTTYTVTGINAAGASTASSATVSVGPALAPYTGLWWNPDESGWGMSVSQHGSMIFAAMYTYDEAGQPTWYVISSCPVSGNGCSGTLYKVSGGTSPIVPWDGSGKVVTSVGTGTIVFADANNATFSFTLDGVSSFKSITREIFATGSTPPVVDYSDLWWNANESGWGVAMTQEYAMIFAAWYAYDTDGKAVWYVASSCPISGNACSGDLYKVTGGSPLTAVWTGGSAIATKVGSITFTFADTNNVTMNYSINGVTASRTMTRQGF